MKIDGKDIRDLKLAGLRRNIGVVFQESLLLNRSIAENLRVGKPDATEDEMRKAAAPQSQDRMMQHVLEQLPDATVISVGHREELEKFHTRRLVLEYRQDGARLVKTRR